MSVKTVKIIKTGKNPRKPNKRVVVINPDGTFDPFQMSYAEFAAARVAELVRDHRYA
jgi:hypothetical protein